MAVQKEGEDPWVQHHCKDESDLPIITSVWGGEICLSNDEENVHFAVYTDLKKTQECTCWIMSKYHLHLLITGLYDCSNRRGRPQRTKPLQR